jgi:hypothetical protein
MWATLYNLHGQPSIGRPVASRPAPGRDGADEPGRRGSSRQANGSGGKRYILACRYSRGSIRQATHTSLAPGQPRPSAAFPIGSSPHRPTPPASPAAPLPCYRRPRLGLGQDCARAIEFISVSAKTLSCMSLRNTCKLYVKYDVNICVIDNVIYVVIYL